MSTFDRRVYWKRGRTMSLRMHLVYCIAMLLFGVAASIIDGTMLWTFFLAAPLVLMAFPPYQEDLDKDSPSWSYALAMGVMIGCLGYFLDYLIT